MKQLLSHFQHGSVAALIVVLLFALAMNAAGQNSGRSEFSPRKLAEKPKHTKIGASDDQSRIEVKFLDGLRFDVNPRGKLLERPVKGVRSQQTRATLAIMDRNGSHWHRMMTLSEELLDEKRGNAERKLSRKIADLNSYYILTVPEGIEAEQWIDMLNELPDVEIATPAPLPAPPPVPGDFQSLQGYLDAATGGVDASSYAWGLPAGTGANVRIVDLEYSWNLSHQDLPSITTLIPAGRTAVDPYSDNNHGTAVLGELASLNNGWGTTGIAYNAQIFVAPTNWDNGYNPAAAITNAAGSLSAGDIILIEQQTGGPHRGAGQIGLVAMDWNKPVYDAIVTAVGTGIHVIEAAGNGSDDLDHADYSTGNGGHHPFDGSINSGAIIVGAGASPAGSTTARSRLDFSNYGSRVNVQGWGENVMTTGYGTYYNTDGTNLWYRSTFGGTSSASPIVAGAVALIESIEENLHGGTPISPASMRGTIIVTGSSQQAGTNPVTEHIGPQPSIRAAVLSYDPCILTCPANITVSNATDQCGATVSYTAPTASTTCGVVTSTPLSGSFFPVGSTTVTANTTSGSSCSFTVTVNDTQSPTITCPADIVANNYPGNC